ncbi:MAG: CYTH and CHAD domain-containing protein [Veillonellales bacterium]
MDRRRKRERLSAAKGILTKGSEPMAVYTETELKLQVTAPGIWDELLTSPLLAAADAEPAVTQSLEARYYDTANQALQQSRLAYRVRREGERWVATVKGDGMSAGGLHCRQEWNVAVEDDAPDIEPFMATPVGFRLRQAVGGAELLPLFITRFQRRIFNISTADGSRIEAAADRGEIVAGETERREPILEVELELKQGQPTVLLQLGAELSRRFPLLPEPKSKYYRGLVLAGLARREDGKSHPPVRLADSDPLGSCLERIMPERVQQVLAVQTEFLRRPKEPEALHELQTALRRLCSLLAFIQPLLPPKEYIRHKAALQQWDRELEPLRKIEELWTEWRSICRQTGNELEQVLALEHHRQAERLAASLAAGRTTPLLLELWGWLLKSPWQNSLSSEVSLDTFVKQRLPQWLE